MSASVRRGGASVRLCPVCAELCCLLIGLTWIAEVQSRVLTDINRDTFDAAHRPFLVCLDAGLDLLLARTFWIVNVAVPRPIALPVRIERARRAAFRLRGASVKGLAAAADGWLSVRLKCRDDLGSCSARPHPDGIRMVSGRWPDRTAEVHVHPAREAPAQLGQVRSAERPAAAAGAGRGGHVGAD